MVATGVLILLRMIAPLLQEIGKVWTDDNICTLTCPEDVTGDGVVNVSDLLAIVGGWGSDDPALDLDGNGSVDTPDLLAVIAAWGDCV